MTGTKVPGVPDAPLIYQPLWTPTHAYDLTDVERTSTPARALNLFDHLDVRDKVVLDLGCNNGFFGFLALERGAKKVIGVDYHEPALLVAESIKSKYHLQIEFIHADLTSSLLPLLGNTQPDVILALNIVHHLPPVLHDHFVKMCGLGAKEVVFEFVQSDPSERLTYLYPLLDTRTVMTVLPTTWYNNKAANDFQGVPRTMIACNDEHVVKKWVHQHDDGNITRFEVCEGIDPDDPPNLGLVCTKYAYRGCFDLPISKRRFYAEHYPVWKDPARLRKIVPAIARDGRFVLSNMLWNMANMGIIHGELYKNLHYITPTDLEPMGMTVLDYDTQFPVDAMTYAAYYNEKVRRNLAHGKRHTHDVSEYNVWWADVDHTNELLWRAGLPLWSEEDLQQYFRKLLEVALPENQPYLIHLLQEYFEDEQ